uniref:HIG1 domain-containing protein n=1 Tax=Rhabditophanes sp. KR3021 TaxID=114890 RepID=A0AC35TWJ9_9BILA
MSEGLEWKVTQKSSSHPKAPLGKVPMIPSDLAGGTGAQDMLKTKFSKALNNPFVPLGMLSTVGCLLGMLVATKNRDPPKAQLYMRGRVAAQGFTIIALVCGGLSAFNWDTSIFFRRPQKAEPVEKPSL